MSTNTEPLPDPAFSVPELQEIFDQAPSCMVLLQGPNHVIRMANKAAQDLLGGQQVVGKQVDEIIPESTKQRFLNILNRIYIHGESLSINEIPFTPPPASGLDTDRYLDILYKPLKDCSGKVYGIYVIAIDITEKRYTQEALKITNERLAFAIEGTKDGVWDWNVKTNEIVLSHRWHAILGYSEDEILSKYSEWSNRIHPEDQDKVTGALRNTLLRDVQFQEEYRLRCKNGQWKWVLSRGMVVKRDKDGNPERLSGTMTDISEKKQAEELIWHHANFDALTGLPNRRLFRDRLEQEIRRARRTNRTIALLFVDLDHFKEVNDLLGHASGDNLLMQVANRLSHCVRDSDTVARFGGDEFAIILSELCDHSHVEDIAQKAISELAESYMYGSKQIQVSASIGIAQFPKDAGQAEELLRFADQAMYAAKHAGRNRFRFFMPAMQEAALERVQLANDLAGALANHQLQLLFQPIVDLSAQSLFEIAIKTN